MTIPIYNMNNITNTKLTLLLFTYMLLLCTVKAQNDSIVITHVNVIPMDRETVLEDQTVIIANGKIQSIADSSKKTAHNGQTIIDGTGKYLIPGLSEMHYHWRNKEGGIERDLKLLIANGITTVRNMAEYDWQDHITVRNKINNKELLGPNYYTTGPYLKAYNLQTEQEVVAVVRQHKEKGYDFLKLADDLPEAIYFKLLEEAYNNGIEVIGHAQRSQPLEYSLRMKSIEHIEEFVYMFSDSERENNDFLEDLAKQIKNSGITVTPTLVVFDMIIQYLDENKFKTLKDIPESKYMLPNDLEYWTTEENLYRKDLKGKVINGVEALPLLEGYFEWMRTFTKLLSDNHVPLMTGSDTFGLVVVGFSLHKEFEFLQDVGMTPYQVLRASTVIPARYLNTISQEGTISVGKNANMVLLNKNPLEDIRHTKSIEGVILKGSWFDRAQLDVMLKEIELTGDVNTESKKN